MSEANPSDFSIIPFGMCASQLSIGRPKTRKGIPLRRKCAATESPYGPAPMIAVLSMREKMLPRRLSQLLLQLGTLLGDPPGNSLREYLVYHGRSWASAFYHL